MKNGEKYSLKSIFNSLSEQMNFLNEAIITAKLLSDTSFLKNLSELKKIEETKIESISNINNKDFLEGFLKEIIIFLKKEAFMIARLPTKEQSYKAKKLLSERKKWLEEFFIPRLQEKFPEFQKPYIQSNVVAITEEDL